MPDRLFLRRVCDHLEPRRLITTEIHVRGPTYVGISVSAGLRIREGHFRDTVINAARRRLEEYLSALPPGGPDREGWPLNRRLMKRDLEAVITRVSGVEFVESMEMGVGEMLHIEDYHLSGLKLPMLVTLSMREGEAESLSSILGPPSTGQPTERPAEVRPLPVPVTKATC
jgi:hypothetical protein